MFTGLASALYRGGYRYAFTEILHWHAITLRAKEAPQGHPKGTLLGFRVCTQMRQGRLKYFLSLIAHRADAEATKRSETATPTVRRRCGRAQERRVDPCLACGFKFLRVGWPARAKTNLWGRRRRVCATRSLRKAILCHGRSKRPFRSRLVVREAGRRV